ncbi:MAG: hypothetical protein JNK15_12445 [Planctomycetes bacterium]|nr:hypothetical protein [Planctomycetota bacterium]
MRSFVVAFTLAHTAGLAQKVDLPAGTGHLRPGPEWVVLDATRLAQKERTDDPKPELARAMLGGVVEELRKRDRTGQHVVLHTTGANDRLRLINCYRADGSAKGSDLRGKTVIDAMKKAIEPTIAAEGATGTFVDHVHPDLFATGSVRLRFEVRLQDQRWFLDYHAVPAGPSLQFFEVLHFPDDPDAEGAIEAVLRSFDGARDGYRRSLLENAMYGGAIGGVLGGLLWWRRRRKAASVPTPGAD